MSEEIRVAIYARVSKRDQHPENQISQLREFSARQNWKIAAEFIDHGESGSRVYDNPASAHRRLREEAQRGAHCRFNLVLVWKFDRFARNCRELHNVLHDFDRAGIRFVSMQENVDTRSLTGKFIFAVLAGAAEMEIGVSRERILAGQERARRQGKHIGHPPRLTSPQIEAAYEMRVRGSSWRAIGRVFRCNKSTARDAVLAWIEKSEARKK